MAPHDYAMIAIWHTHKGQHEIPIWYVMLFYLISYYKNDAWYPMKTDKYGYEYIVCQVILAACFH